MKNQAGAIAPHATADATPTLTGRSAAARPSSARDIPETYRQLRRWLAFIVGLFFRRYEVAGVANIPLDRGGILVAWHPNGLVDPALILCTFPRHVVFGARHTLFRYPLLGRFVKALGTVPIYRRMDTPGHAVDDQRQRNDASLDALADAIVAGSFAALFPEGYSHDTPFLREVKTGAARLYYRARSRTPAGALPPVIIPVGLHYDHKRVFRSGVLVEFHKPLVLSTDIDVTPSLDDDPERGRELARALTDRIESELKSIIMETESWELHALLHRARKLIRAERASRAGASPGSASMDEKVTGLARIWTAYTTRAGTMPERVATLRRRVERYHRDMLSLRIDDHELDAPPASRPLFWLALTAQVVLVVLLLPPLLLIGGIINLPPAILVMLGARWIGREDKDMASLKLVGGITFFPLAWALWTWLAVHFAATAHPLFGWLPDNPIAAGLIMLVLAMVGAAVLLVYSGLAISTWRSIRVRVTRGRRARSLLRLKVERGRLCDDLLEMAAGIDLPGVVGVDGRVSRVIR